MKLTLNHERNMEVIGVKETPKFIVVVKPMLRFLCGCNVILFLTHSVAINNVPSLSRSEVMK